MDTKHREVFEKKRQKALQGGGEEKLQERRDNGLMTARDRVSKLMDYGSFQESGLFAKHHCHDFGMQKKDVAADGVVTGVGSIDGRFVGIYSQDFTAIGGSLGHMHAMKICEVADLCMKSGIPFVGFNDSGGARIQEGVNSLSGYGQIFQRNVKASGVIPQISVICGPCAGGAAYSPALCDFIIMVRNSAHMFITGPDVIKSVTFEQVTKDDIGSADMHSSVSGNVHFTVDSDEEAVRTVKRLLSFLPSNNMMDPPHELNMDINFAPDMEIADIIPDNSNKPFSVHKVIERVVDNADFMEVQAQFAMNLVVGFARLGGVVVGIVANNPAVKAGCLDIDASDKGSRFIMFCNAFNIPLVTLVDTPGFLPGVKQEKGGIIRHGAKMLYAYAATSVPKLTLIMRKSYGGAYLAMCSKDLGADAVLAWPCAEIAVMGAQQAINILYRKELKEAEDPQAKAVELVEDYRDKFASPYQAASLNMIEGIVDPSATRATLARLLRLHLTKRVETPAKKNGNMPV